MDLQPDVLTGAERAADAAEHQADRSSGRPRQAAICLRSSCSHCVAMCSSTPRPSSSGIGQGRLEPEERLVLHADLVGALDDDVAGGVDGRRTRIAGGGGRCRRDGSAAWLPAIAASGSSSGSSTSYVDVDRGERPPARLGVVGRDGRDRLADVAHEVVGEHRLVVGDQPVGRLAGHVGRREHGLHARDPPRRRHVEAHDAGVRVRRAQGRAPQHAVDRRGPTRTRRCPASWRSRRGAPASRRAAAPLGAPVSTRVIGDRLAAGRRRPAGRRR